jgi:hypothetical protein
MLVGTATVAAGLAAAAEGATAAGGALTRAARAFMTSIWVAIDSTRLARSAFSRWSVRTSARSEETSAWTWLPPVAHPDRRRRAAAAALAEVEDKSSRILGRLPMAVKKRRK